MTATPDVVRWAQRIVATRGATPHELLELRPGAAHDAAQQAFHAVARRAHPDLHRNTLTPEQLELVTTAYARVAGAYHELCLQRRRAASTPPTARPMGLGSTGITQPPPQSPPSTPAPPPTAAPTGPAAAMNRKALLYYRKAELALNRGDLSGARLQLKLAIAGDPQSPFLRNALAELEAELARNGSR